MRCVYVQLSIATCCECDVRVLPQKLETRLGLDSDVLDEGEQKINYESTRLPLSVLRIMLLSLFNNNVVL